MLTAIIFTFMLIETSTASSYVSNLYKQLYQLNDVDMVLVVRGDGKQNSINATLSVYQWEVNKWKGVKSYPSVIGKNGFATDKREGDGRTPVGIYELGDAFGVEKNKDNILWNYKNITKYDYWVDDQKSDDYNQWIHYKGNPYKKWNSFERLTHPLYRNALIIQYNMEPIQKGKGSAIFIHEWRNAKSPTLGCIAIKRTSLQDLLTILPSSKKKVLIVMGDDTQIIDSLIKYSKEQKESI